MKTNKKILFILFGLYFTLGVSVAYAIGDFARPRQGTGFAGTFTPYGKGSIVIGNTKARRVVDMRGFSQYAFDSNTSCRVRSIPTATFSNYTAYKQASFIPPTVTAYGTVNTITAHTGWVVRGVSLDTPFVDFSGCRMSTIERQ